MLLPTLNISTVHSLFAMTPCSRGMVPPPLDSPLLPPTPNRIPCARHLLRVAPPPASMVPSARSMQLPTFSSQRHTLRSPPTSTISIIGSVKEGWLIQHLFNCHTCLSICFNLAAMWRACDLCRWILADFAHPVRGKPLGLSWGEFRFRPQLVPYC